MATDAGEIERKHGPGAAGPGELPDPPLTGHSSAAEVVLSYLRDQAAAIARCDPLVRRDEPDAVHQMRVATRRARSALQAFGRIIDAEATRSLGEELKWLGVTLGQARDTEVMLDLLEASLAGIPSALVAGPVEARISAHFTAELAQAGKTAVAALDGRRYRRLRDDLDRLLVRPPLTPLAEPEAGEVLVKPVRRAGRRLLGALAAVPGADDRDTALHEARKAAKRARYAAEAAGARAPAARPAARPRRPRTCSSCSATTTTASSPGQCCSISPERPGRQGRTPSPTACCTSARPSQAARIEQALPPFTAKTLA